MKIETKFDIGETVLFVEPDADAENDIFLGLDRGEILGISSVAPISYDIDTCCGDCVEEKNVFKDDINDELINYLKKLHDEILAEGAMKEAENEKY